MTARQSLGIAGASAIVGGMADAHGAQQSFLVSVGAGLLLGGCALMLVRRLRRVASKRPPSARDAIRERLSIVGALAGGMITREIMKRIGVISWGSKVRT